jgi:FSR family fosmidomycin resistance protein-like MFS transporter
MSFFSVGGNLGVGLGVVVTTPLVVALGLNGGLLIAVPTLVVAAILLGLVRFLSSFAPEGRRAAQAATGDDQPGALLLLLGVITFRSRAWFGLITFVPLWEVSLGHSKAYGNHLLSLMLLVGGAGTLVAGAAADRFGRRLVLLAANVVAGPMILVFVVVGGVPGILALAVAGVAIVGTFGVTMVMSQEYLPRRIGMASGLSIGFSIGLGGIAAVFLGAIADSVDLRTAFYIAAAGAFVSIPLTALLPSSRARGVLAPDVVVP